MSVFAATQDVATNDLPQIEGGSKKDKNQADLHKSDTCAS